MGLGPSSQPPGKHSLASPHLETIAPRNTMEDRISRMRHWGTSQQVAAFSMTRLPSCQRHRQPRCSKIRQAVSTSESLGQLCSTVSPRASTAAASRGRALFFAPWTDSSPERAPGPWITIMANTSLWLAYAIL